MIVYRLNSYSEMLRFVAALLIIFCFATRFFSITNRCYLNFLNWHERCDDWEHSAAQIDTDSAGVVWINSTVYEDGAELEDKSKIKVMVGDEVRVRITAPDGKNYYATSGETLEFTYLASVAN